MFQFISISNIEHLIEFVDFVVLQIQMNLVIFGGKKVICFVLNSLYRVCGLFVDILANKYLDVAPLTMV